MKIQELIEELKIYFPEDILDIKDCVDLLSESIDSAYSDIQKSSDTAFTNHDFKKINLLLEAAEKVSKIQNYINLLSDKLEIDESKDKRTDNSSDDHEIRQLPDYSKYVVDKNIPHNLYEDFTNKCPSSFSLCSERTTAEHWKDLFLLTCETLAKNDNYKFVKSALDKTMQGRKINYFSESERHMRRPEKLKSANIYVETNLSANQIRNILAKLIRLCGYSITDYNIFLRADYTSLHQ